MKPRFLLDEHVNRAVQRQLRRLDRRIEVLAIGDSGAPLAGTEARAASADWVIEHLEK